MLLAAATGARTPVTSPDGAEAEAEVAHDGAVLVRVAAGDPLDEVVLRSYCVGATHQALSWVRSESLAVADDGTVADLTIRSFGIVRAADTPSIVRAVFTVLEQRVSEGEISDVIQLLPKELRELWP